MAIEACEVCDWPHWGDGAVKLYTVCTVVHLDVTLQKVTFVINKNFPREGTFFYSLFNFVFILMPEDIWYHSFI